MGYSVYNSPLRYTDPSGFFEEDQLKEWFPDLWEFWKENRENFWNMLLAAEFGDTLVAHFGAYGGLIMEGEDGKPVIWEAYHATNLGKKISLKEWDGSPGSRRSFAYSLAHYDSEENVWEGLYFGSVSSIWTQSDKNGFYTVYTRYVTRWWSNDSVYDKIFNPGRPVLDVPDSVDVGIDVAAAAGLISTGGAGTVLGVKVLNVTENALVDDLVVEEARVHRDWYSSQYRPMWGQGAHTEYRVERWGGE